MGSLVTETTYRGSVYFWLAWPITWGNWRDLKHFLELPKVEFPLKSDWRDIEHFVELLKIEVPLRSEKTQL